MYTKTYDRNISKGIAFNLNERGESTRYVNIKTASSHIDDVSFFTLKNLHLDALRNPRSMPLEFDPNEWVRYLEHMELHTKLKA